MAEQIVRAPAEEDITRIAKQVLIVDALAETHLGRGVVNDPSDLDVLQEILDRGLLAPSQTYELQCLGIVFGRCLVAAIEGLDWCVVEDEYGTDPALRHAGSTILLYPLTMISKRVEDGEHVDVRGMLDGVCARVTELEELAAGVH
jgi:hypothetical protein